MKCNPFTVAVVLGLVGASTGWAADESANPWDEKAATTISAKPRKLATSAPAPAASRAARNTGKTASHAAAQAAEASPFGAPVPAKGAPTIKWGEPIALTPSPAASVPRVQVAAAAASAPAVAATSPKAEVVPEARGASATTIDNSWKLVRGIALHTQLQKWAAMAGWQLEWKLNRSWIVPADARLTGSFDQAVEQVIQALANEGKPVNLVIWEGNHVAEVNETAPR